MHFAQHYLFYVNQSNRRTQTMNRIVIVGAGFAGMYAALSAARLRDEQGVSPDTLEIAVVAPEPRLVALSKMLSAAISCEFCARPVV
jgi:hypothetical protein